MPSASRWAAVGRLGGTGVNNPTGDSEIFIMNPDGTSVRQLTFDEATDYRQDRGTLYILSLHSYRRVESAPLGFISPQAR